MTTNATATGYIVYQSGRAIFGMGATLEAATIDARQWADGHNCDAARGGSGEIRDQFYWLPASAALLAQVEAGGVDSWGVVDGVACTTQEEG